MKNHKSFRQKVIDTLISEEWNILYRKDIPFIDFFSVRRGTKMKKAYRIKQHRHLTHKEQTALYEYGKQMGIHVIYVHEMAGRELEFIRLYPRFSKSEVIQ